VGRSKRGETMTNDIMTPKDVAEYLKIGNRSIQAWTTSGYIPAFKLVGSWRYRKSEIDNWLESKRNNKS